MDSRNTPEEEAAFVDRLMKILSRSEFEAARTELRRYLHDGPFTGRWFEHFAGTR